MAKVYQITDKEIELLLTRIDRDPTHGRDGGSSRGDLSLDEVRIYHEAHRFYNYQVRKWLDEIQQ